jgi:hypothetical protein
MESGLSPEQLKQAQRALNEILNRFAKHSKVTAIDIGRPSGETETKQLVVRIFVDQAWLERDPASKDEFPTEVEGFPVQVIPDKRPHIDEGSKSSSS